MAETPNRRKKTESDSRGSHAATSVAVGSKAGAKSGRFGSLARRISGTGPGWTKAIRWLVFSMTALVLAGALTFFVLYRAIAIPDPNADFLTETTKVYYSDGKSQIGTFANQDRESISIDDIPEVMQAAAIAAEDRSFYDNSGIDVRGIIRALRDNTASGEVRSGGSTITQQYVKILYLTQERSYKRKAKEAILSVKIHNQLSKREIMEGYLNTIYFGNGAYGVQVAAQTYFGKDAKQLNYAESALLSTIINSPSYYDPYGEGAKDRIMPRFNYVLDGMEKSAAITADERERYRDRLPKLAKRSVSNRFGGPKGYLLDMVQKELVAAGFSESDITGGGYRIVTTISKSRQKAAIEAVRLNKPQAAKELNTSLVSIEPGTGAVQALYGGPDYVKSPLNWATEKTQPGSTFKTFAVIAALEDGYSLYTRLNGNSPVAIGGGTVANQGDSGGASFGPVTLERATQKSINTAFVDLTVQMGNQNIATGAGKVLKAAEQAGIPTSTTSKIDKVAVTSLGYAPVSPIDMANAYATIAAGGKRADWYMVDRVELDGQERYEHKVSVKQAVPAGVAGDTIRAMRSVMTGAGTGANGATKCPTAGKTGTATAGPDDNQHVSSSWFAGFTPKLATAVMYNRGRGNEALDGYMVPFFGGQIPARTFSSYMNQALSDDPAACGQFAAPGNISASKGGVAPPVPQCGPGQVLNNTRTGCVDAGPQPTQTPEPTPSPTPAPTTPEPTNRPEEPCIPGQPGCGDDTDPGDEGRIIPPPRR